MREGELAIFFKIAKPGVKSRGEERKVPSNRPLTRLDVGRRAKGERSAPIDSEWFEKIESLLLLVKDVSWTKVLVNLGCSLAGEAMSIMKRRDCNNWDPLVDLLIAIVAPTTEETDVWLGKLYKAHKA